MEGNKAQPIRRIQEKTFRQELRDLIYKHAAKGSIFFPENATGEMLIHWNSGNIDWTKMELINPL